MKAMCKELGNIAQGYGKEKGTNTLKFEPFQKMEKLKLLKDYNKFYYDRSEPIVSDHKYDELKKSIENFISQELNYDDLLNVTNIISNYYRTRGFLATAYLPEQNINEGIIIIKIVEGKLGKIIIDTGSSEINLSNKYPIASSNAPKNI